MKVHAPLFIAIHCCGHRLNLSLKYTVRQVKPLRDCLDVQGELYNFIEASPKRHGEYVNTQEEQGVIPVSLKSLSETRWNARKSAVKAINERLCHVFRTLVVMEK